MATSATIPVTVSAEARARVAELGLQNEFEQMLEHALRTVPELHRVRVELEEQTDEIDDPLIVLWSHKELPATPGPDPVEPEWTHWFVRNFAPEVIANMVMICIYEDSHGR